jgi:hypothetical protein
VTIEINELVYSVNLALVYDVVFLTELDAKASAITAGDSKLALALQDKIRVIAICESYPGAIGTAGTKQSSKDNVQFYVSEASETMSVSQPAKDRVQAASI